MVNVRNRRCEGLNCTKEPYFGHIGGKAKFCARHKPHEAMVDVRHRRCEFPSCTKQPNYGYEGQRACYCSTHKLPTMVDVKHRRCAADGCRGFSNFAFPGTKEKFCDAHRREGMVPSGRGRAVTAAAAAAPAPPAPVPAPTSTLATGGGSSSVKAEAAVGSPSSSGVAPMMVVASGGVFAATAATAAAAQGSEDGGRRRACWSEERGGGGVADSSSRTSSGNPTSVMVVDDYNGDGAGYRKVARVHEQQQQQQQQQQHEQKEGSAAAVDHSFAGEPVVFPLDRRRRSCPPDLGTAAKEYVAQQRQSLLLQQGETMTPAAAARIGTRPLEAIATGQQQPQQQRRRLETYPGDDQAVHQRHSLVRSLSAEQRRFQTILQQQQQQRPQLRQMLPLPVPFSFGGGGGVAAASASASPRTAAPPLASERPLSWSPRDTRTAPPSSTSSSLSSSPSPSMAFPLGASMAAAGGKDGGGDSSSARSSAASREQSPAGNVASEEGGGGRGRGEGRWPRAPMDKATAAFCGSHSFGFGAVRGSGVGVNSALTPSVSFNLPRRADMSPTSGSESGTDGGRTTVAAEEHNRSPAAAVGTTHGVSSGGESPTTWADTALVSRQLPTVEGLLPPAPVTAHGMPSVPSLDPHWRRRMPRARKPALFRFGGRAGGSASGGGGGGCNGGASSQPSSCRWPTFISRRTAAAVVSPGTDGDGESFARRGGDHAGGGELLSSASVPRASWLGGSISSSSPCSSSAVVTLHGGRNNEARLAKLSLADRGAGDALGPTLETLELEFVGRKRE
ncbi:unnamed protein product [Ectocarpus sp. 4 AP-2014]